MTVVAKGWVLMRWLERTFVKRPLPPSPRRWRQAQWIRDELRLTLPFTCALMFTVLARFWATISDVGPTLKKPSYPKYSSIERTLVKCWATIINVGPLVKYHVIQYTYPLASVRVDVGAALQTLVQRSLNTCLRIHVSPPSQWLFVI